jgi:hypothetical protein
VSPEVLLDRAISKRAVERVANPHGRRTNDTNSPVEPTARAKIPIGRINLRILTPLARRTTISESPHMRAKASITPRRVDIGRAISKKVGMIAKKTLAI